MACKQNAFEQDVSVVIPFWWKKCWKCDTYYTHFVLVKRSRRCHFLWPCGVFFSRTKRKEMNTFHIPLKAQYVHFSTPYHNEIIYYAYMKLYSLSFNGERFRFFSVSHVIVCVCRNMWCALQAQIRLHWAISNDSFHLV